MFTVYHDIPVVDVASTLLPVIAWYMLLNSAKLGDM